MARTILDLVNQAAAEIGFPSVSYLNGSTDKNSQRFLALAKAEGEESSSQVMWPQLEKLGTVTLVANQANYVLPYDFDRIISETGWDSSNKWPLWGPVTASEWQSLKYSTSGSTLPWAYRAYGSQSNQFYLDPTPATGDAGKILAFRYYSKWYARPKTWKANTAFQPGTFCSYNGYYFYTTAGGTSGTEAPDYNNPNINSYSTYDGGITWLLEGFGWTYSNVTPYEPFVHDADELNIPERSFVLGLKWRMKKATGFEWQDLYQEYLIQRQSEIGKLNGGRILDIAGQNNRYSWLNRELSVAIE